MVEQKTFIREADSKDAENIRRLAFQLGYEPSLESVLETIRNQSDEHLIIVVELEDHVVGWIEVAISNTIAVGKDAMIVGLVVDEPERGQRLGEALVGAAEIWASENGLDSIRVRSRAMRKDAHRFYERLGYEVHKEQVVFRKGLKQNVEQSKDENDDRNKAVEREECHVDLA